jgi:hypothetical protein
MSIGTPTEYHNLLLLNMQRSEVMRRSDIDKKTEKLNEDVPVSEQPNKVNGSLYGVPADEVLAWVKSWPTDQPLPKPKVRRLR